MSTFARCSNNNTIFSSVIFYIHIFRTALWRVRQYYNTRTHAHIHTPTHTHVHTHAHTHTHYIIIPLQCYRADNLHFFPLCISYYYLYVLGRPAHSSVCLPSFSPPTPNSYNLWAHIIMPHEIPATAYLRIFIRDCRRRRQ